ncbi:MAG TPA: DUF6789 family protein [Ktedonobacteraceae bacterium]|nr:DUF6789 family protein [Ktedonobacteraceae bacterium]
MPQNFDIREILNILPLRQGAMAGLIATIPMTLFMLAAHRLLPDWQKYALPPERVTNEIAERTEVAEDMNKPQSLGATLVSHFGFGTSMGALYSPVAKKVPLSPVVKGIAFGLLVWAANYLGIFSALKMRESAFNEPGRRNAMMIASHVIWGGTLGIVENWLERR